MFFIFARKFAANVAVKSVRIMRIDERDETYAIAEVFMNESDVLV
jgi:hypothetical protein